MHAANTGQAERIISHARRETQFDAIQLERGPVVKATPHPLSGARRSQDDASDVDPGAREWCV